MTDWAEVRTCREDRCWPAWFTDEPSESAVCQTCREPVYHDGEAWRHITR